MPNMPSAALQPRLFSLVTCRHFYASSYSKAADKCHFHAGQNKYSSEFGRRISASAGSLKAGFGAGDILFDWHIIFARRYARHRGRAMTSGQISIAAAAGQNYVLDAWGDTDDEGISRCDTIIIFAAQMSRRQSSLMGHLSWARRRHRARAAAGRSTAVSDALPRRSFLPTPHCGNYAKMPSAASSQSSCRTELATHWPPTGERAHRHARFSGCSLSRCRVTAVKGQPAESADNTAARRSSRLLISKMICRDCLLASLHMPALISRRKRYLEEALGALHSTSRSTASRPIQARHSPRPAGGRILLTRLDFEFLMAATKGRLTSRRRSSSSSSSSRHD